MFEHRQEHSFEKREREPHTARQRKLKLLESSRLHQKKAAYWPGSLVVESVLVRHFLKAELNFRDTFV